MITSREYQVLDLYAQGYVGKEIGLLLGIQEQTVKNHLANVYAKLNVSNGRQAMYKLGWTTPRRYVQFPKSPKWARPALPQSHPHEGGQG